MREAYSTIYVDFTFAEPNTDGYIALIQVQMDGHYYCSGSCNFDLTLIKLAEFDPPDLKEDEISAMGALVTYEKIRHALNGTQIRAKLVFVCPKGTLISHLSGEIESMIEVAIDGYTPS